MRISLLNQFEYQFLSVVQTYTDLNTLKSFFSKRPHCILRNYKGKKLSNTGSVMKNCTHLYKNQVFNADERTVILRQVVIERHLL